MTPKQMASVLKYHHKICYNFVVPNVAIPKFAYSKFFPLPGTQPKYPQCEQAGPEGAGGTKNFSDLGGTLEFHV